jgi:biopolymer transport protein ExbD
MAVQRRILPPKKEAVQPDVSLAIVNIVLLLILFFLATGALTNSSLPAMVQVSETSDLPIAQLPSPVLTVLPAGGLLLDGEVILIESLEQMLADDTIVHILIDRDAPATELLEVLSQNGMERLDIRLVTIHRRDET